MKPKHLFLFLLLTACAGPSYVYKGVQDGIEVSYRWNHPANKPSELLLKLENTTDADKGVSLDLDLYYQGRTVETFRADTCMRVGQTLNGKVNGIYFIPGRLSTEQIKSGDANVELTRMVVSDTTACP